MKHHFIQWAKDYSFGRVACGKQGHGKSTDPTGTIPDRDTFFFMAALSPEDCCQHCLRELTTKTPKRAARIAAMQAAGKTLAEVKADTAARRAAAKEMAAA